MQEHPDKKFAGYTLRGIGNGFRIGFDPGQYVLKDRPSNMLSVEEHPEIVTEYLREELALGRLVELNAYTARSIGVHTSPF